MLHLGAHHSSLNIETRLTAKERFAYLFSLMEFFVTYGFSSVNVSVNHLTLDNYNARQYKIAS